MATTPRHRQESFLADRTTVYLSNFDRHVLAAIQARYGLPTMSAALRYAVRRVHELEEQQTVLTEQLTSLRRELARGQAELCEQQQERKLLLHEMENLNAELQDRMATALFPPQFSSERMLLRQQGEHERDTARQLCTRAQHLRADALLQLRRCSETVTRLVDQTYSAMTDR